jgi:LysM repeat protein
MIQEGVPAVKATACLLFTLAVLVPLSALAAEEAAPAVSITSPEQGVTIASDTVTVSATYTAPAHAPIALCQLAVDGRAMEELVVEPPQDSGEASFRWMVAQYAEGSHRVTVRIVDTEGGSAEATISVLVTRAQPIPLEEIQISSPTSGDTVSGTTPVQINTGEAGLARYVIFLVDDVFKAMTNVPPFTYVWDTTRYLNGVHKLQAKAYLSSGSLALSPVVEVHVDNPSGATSLRETPSASPRAAQVHTVRQPVRTGQPLLPPPIRTESPTPESSTITVARAELGVPGTAPFVSPSGDLIRPPGPLAGKPTPGASPVRIATLPTSVAEDPPVAIVADTAVVAPPAPLPQPTHTPAPSPTTAPASAVGSPVTAPSLSAAPTQVALLPDPTPPQAAPVPPVTTVASHTADQAPLQVVEPAGAEQSDLSETVIAMLPAPLPERTPVSRVTAQPAPREAVHVVRPGDHLWAIAAAYNVSPAALARANDLADAAYILPGQRLRVPVNPVYFDGHPIAGDVPTVIANGRAIVPLRAVVEETGGTVTWDSSTRQAHAAARGRDIIVIIGSEMASVDGESVAMGATAALRQDRTVVPLRFLGDVLDLLLQYEDGIIHIASAR